MITTLDWFKKEFTTYKMIVYLFSLFVGGTVFVALISLPLILAVLAHSILYYTTSVVTQQSRISYRVQHTYPLALEVFEDVAICYMESDLYHNILEYHQMWVEYISRAIAVIVIMTYVFRSMVSFKKFMEYE
jgi:hypothetical protein